MWDRTSAFTLHRGVEGKRTRCFLTGNGKSVGVTRCLLFLFVVREIKSEEFLSGAMHAVGIAGILRFAQDDRAHFLGLLFVIPRLDSHPHCKSGWGRSIVLAVEGFPTSRAREK